MLNPQVHSPDSWEAHSPSYLLVDVCSHYEDAMQLELIQLCRSILMCVSYWKEQAAFLFCQL